MMEERTPGATADAQARPWKELFVSKSQPVRARLYSPDTWDLRPILRRGLCESGWFLDSAEATWLLRIMSRLWAPFGGTAGCDTRVARVRAR